MPVTIEQARNQIYGVLQDALEASAFDDLKVLYDDTDTPPPVDVRTPWARANIRHADGNASSLGGATGKKRYTRIGLVIIQLFTPVGNGMSSSDALVGIVLNAYEQGSAADGVWFRKARPVDIGRNDGWTQTNVMAEFEYDSFH